MDERKNELHRKIGRNLTMFQRAEACLKHLVFIGNLSLKSKVDLSNKDHLKKHISVQRQDISNLTIGRLLTKFFKYSLSNNSRPKPTEYSGGIDLDFRFTYGTAAQQKELRKNLNRLRQERNKLAHELFFAWDLNSNEGLAALESDLDEKYSKYLPLTNELVNLCKHLQTLSISAFEVMSKSINENEQSEQTEQEKIPH